MQKQKSVYNHLPELGRSTLDARKAIGRWPRKTKTTLIGSTKIGTRIKTRLSHTISLLLIVSLRLRPPKKISIQEVVKEAIQPLKSMPPR